MIYVTDRISCMNDLTVVLNERTNCINVKVAAYISVSERLRRRSGLMSMCSTRKPLRCLSAKRLLSKCRQFRGRTAVYRFVRARIFRSV